MEKAKNMDKNTDNTHEETFLFNIADYIVQTADNEKTQKTAKEIRAFYEEEKAASNNPDPELFLYYMSALLPKSEQRPCIRWEKSKKIAREFLCLSSVEGD